MQLLESLTAVPAPLERDPDGVFRVTGTRVRLDTIVTAFQQGSSAEEVVLKFPTLQLTDVYSVITYYLWHRQEVDDYLQQRRELAASVKAENEIRFPSQGIRQRLLAQRNGIVKRMRLAFSSNAYMRFSIEQTIARVAAAGYQGIEILADVPHAWPVLLLPERKQSIRDHLQQHQLTISNVNAFMMNAIGDPRQPYWHPGWTDPDPHYRAIRREHTRRAATGPGTGGAEHHHRARRLPGSRTKSAAGQRVVLCGADALRRVGRAVAD